MAESLGIVSTSPAQTVAIGRVLGELLRGGEVVELCGPLGAGKTQFAKGLALGLGVPEHEHVVSPTFVLVREYAGRLTLLHCDAYRLGSPEELLDLGLEESLESGAVVAIEWADRFPGALTAQIARVDLEYDGESFRRITLTAPNAAFAEILRSALEAIGLTPNKFVQVRPPKQAKG